LQRETEGTLRGKKEKKVVGQNDPRDPRKKNVDPEGRKKRPKGSKPRWTGVRRKFARSRAHLPQLQEGKSSEGQKRQKAPVKGKGKNNWEAGKKKKKPSL